MQTVFQTVAIVAVSIGAALLGQAVVRARVRSATLAAHTDVAGFVYAALAVVYGVILAQVIVAAWEDYEEARAAAAAEASALLDLFRLAEGWPESERGVIEAALIAYGRAVIDEEWPAMARNEIPAPGAVDRMRDVWRAYETIEATVGEGARYAVSLEELDELDDARGDRLGASRRGLPGVMWAVLIVGGVLTVAFAYLFAVENAIAQGVMLASLAALVAILLILIQALDQPFQGGSRVTPAAFERIVSFAEAEAG